MCDTLGFKAAGASYFAKNSDRGPNEPQIVEFIPAKSSKDNVLHCTYIDIPQVPETHAVLLSRPAWMWGAEMGVNDCGVVIGNEAVWTKGPYNKEGVLTGMDLLRLALERSSSAAEARELIIMLLQQYGQGGNCGFDHDFFYDNSFLIMDREHIFILETAGKEWVWKETDRGSISNRLSIHKEGDRYSKGTPYDFAARHADPLFNLGSGSAPRLAQSCAALSKVNGEKGLFAALRTHKEGVENPFAAGTVDSMCMHFGGMVGDHTTASMVVTLEADRTVVWTTGSSCPCVSVFKPWIFGAPLCAPIFSEETESDAQEYWRTRETYNRAILGHRVPAVYLQERDELESAWLRAMHTTTAADMKTLAKQCTLEEQRLMERHEPADFPKAKYSKAFMKRWEKKNKILS